jgi:hypothetical protein
MRQIALRASPRRRKPVLMRCALMAIRYLVVADRQQNLHEVHGVHYKACGATLYISDEEQPYNRAAPL